jgi:internalin A
MVNLRELDLNDTQVTDAGLADLRELAKLEVLRLRGTKMIDSGFREHLLDLKELKRLDLSHTAISDEVIED